MTPFTLRVVQIIQNIPQGKVMTYGQIARLAGSPRGARQVVRVLHSLSKPYKLPWHRVINSKGQLGLKDESYLIQKLSLETEGVQFTSGNGIDLERYQFHPDVLTTGDSHPRDGESGGE
ncbi:MGMT family protein [Alicyclobacillus fastidiosus]|uniref:MGMT family protein n=1 Tax=Alicyclobacillus fastidiosus TaxID=392011 RepID=A0ABV5ADI4_9BACL|nr:MGMT family protein [Alicyclobacillus fastidiosus]WEH11386.1 MGMT family protein [Alicyclobacillus fastidiosus]